MNFLDKKEELEAAGFTLSTSGKNILKDGRAIAGETPEGNIWSGSRDLTALLKGKAPEAKPKSEPKPKAKGLGAKRPKASPPKGKTKSDVSALAAPPKVTTSKLPKPNRGRGDGLIEMASRAIDKKTTPAKEVNAGASVSTKTKGKGTKPLVLRGTLAGTKYAGEGKYTYSEWQRMSRAERKKAGLPVSVLGGATYKGFK